MSMLLLSQARSFLFVPGNRPERFAKALASGADAVIVDLEDAVPLDAKDAARAALAAAWPGFDAAQRAGLLVRVNPAGTPWHEADLALLASLPGLGAVMLPKAENPQQIERAFHACGVPVLPLIEMADLTQMSCLAEVHESDVGQVRLGQIAEMKSASLSRTIRGRVRRIDRVVGASQMRSASPLARSDFRSIGVWIQIDPEDVAVASERLQLQVEVRIEK